MSNIKKKIVISVDVSPIELCNLFWDMDADEQADFFNELSEINAIKFSAQMASVSQSKKLKESGRKAMLTIGNRSLPF